MRFFIRWPVVLFSWFALACHSTALPKGTTGGVAADVGAPTISFTSPTAGSTVEVSAINVIGTASALSPIATLSYQLNGGAVQSFQQSGLLKTLPFNLLVQGLALGGNTVTVSVTTTTGLSANASLSINYRMPPLATAQSLTTLAQAPLTITLNGSDVFASASLSYAIANGPAHGVLSAVSPLSSTSATVTYTSSFGFVGTDSFTFTVNDGYLTSTAALVTITVNYLGAPIVVGQTLSTIGNLPLPVVLSATDTVAQTFTFTTSSPAHGTLSGTAPNLTYQSTPGYIGTDSFTFAANDGFVTSAPATVMITISYLGPPVALGQVATGPSSTAIPITLEARDPEPSYALTYALETLPQNGSATLSGNQLTYTSNAGFGGTDSFTFTANDGFMTSPPATVYLLVWNGTIYVNQATGLDTNSGLLPTDAKLTIQAGITAASTASLTAMVSIAPGIYPENLVITQSLLLTGPVLTPPIVAGSNEPSVVIQPTTIPPATNSNQDEPFIAIGDSTDQSTTGPTVVLANLKIDGSQVSAAEETTSGSPFFGIAYYQGTIGAVQNDFLYYVRMPDGFFGDQLGDALQSDGADLEVSHSLFSSYQKGAIRINRYSPVPYSSAIRSLMTVHDCEFDGTDPAAFLSPTQQSQNDIEVLNNAGAVIANNAFVNLGSSGVADPAYENAKVASDGSTGTPVLIYAATYDPANQVAVIGNTFTNVQAVYYDGRGDPGGAATAQAIYVPAFLADNTIIGGEYYAQGRFSQCDTLYGQRNDDDNYFNFNLATEAQSCTPATASSCILNIGPGNYCMLSPLFDPNTLLPVPPPVTITAPTGVATIKIPDASLPAGVIAGSGVSFEFNQTSCP